MLVLGPVVQVEGCIMRRLVLALAALGIVSIPGAFAADMPTKAPMAPAYVPFNWTGFYVGAQVGGGWGTHDRSVLPPGFQNSYNSSGVLGGLYGGYNWQFQSVVVGLETDINWTGIQGDDGGAGGSLDQTKVKWLGSVRGRLGYAWDRILVFATGGWAYAGLEHFNNSGAGETLTKNQSGWTVGGGLEYALNPKWLVRAEYRYYDLGTYQNSAPTNGVLPYEVKNKLSTVTAGIAYKF